MRVLVCGIVANPRRLIVNADDFGFTADVNRGIVHCFTNGIVRSTTLMANGAAFDDAVLLARRHPKLDVGCHLVLIGSEALSEPGRGLASSVGALVANLPSKEWIAAEFSAQVDKLLAAGIKPTHLDTHKHTHLLPRVLEAALRTARKYEIRWVRRPFDLPLGTYRAGLARTLVSMAVRPLAGPFHKRLERAACRATDYFAGFQMTGDYQAEQLVDLLAELPPGLGEFMCHPGYCGAELRGAPTKLKESREAELRALTAPQVLQRASELRIEFTSFADL